MPLQIRRGTDAERLLLAVPLANGELLWTTDSKKLFIGDGTTVARDLTAVINYNDDDAQDAAGSLIAAASTTDITFSYNSTSNSLTAAVNISEFRQNVNMGGFTLNGAGEINIDGDILATGRLVGNYSGSLFGDDSALLVDGVNSVIVGPINSPSITGPLTGNVVGNVTGNVTGNVVGNITGYHTGDMTGSIFSDDSTILVDAISRRFYTSNLEISENNINADSFTLRVNSSNSQALEIVGVSTGLPGGFPYTHFHSSRGSLEQPTDTQAGDIIGGFGFRGYRSSDGYKVFGGNLVSALAPGADPNDVASKNIVTLSTGAGGSSVNYFNFTDTYSFNAKVLHISAFNPGTNSYVALADISARDTAIPSPSPGMITYVEDNGSGSPKFQGYVSDTGGGSPGWIDLH